ncbi:molybdopterin-dependent oxidoreductase [Chloroflexota bacterium]
MSWDEALDTIATQLNGIKARYGPEAVAFARSSVAGCPVGEFFEWTTRFVNAFGSPNGISATHICQWARDVASAYTFGAGQLVPELDKSACMLIWGVNPHNTQRTLVRDIKQAQAREAKLIVVDPRRTELAAMADLLTQMSCAPGTASGRRILA